MKSPRPLLLVSRFLFSSLLLLAVVSGAHAGDAWKPVDPAELASKQPVVEKDADAEVIFWDVRVAEEEDVGLVFTNYVRIKIFTDRGKESQSKIDILFRGDAKIQDVAGRTIRPDGSIVELKKSDIYERTIIRASGLKVKAKSFAMPGIEPGSIIEYRWREIRGMEVARYERLQFQRDIPCRLITYHIKPVQFPGFPYGMRAEWFHMPHTVLNKERDGFTSASVTNVPAFHEESRMPPEDEVRWWMLIYYTKDTKQDTPDKYWNEKGRELYDNYKSLVKVNDEVRRAAQEATAGAGTPEEKLDKLFVYCREKIKNTSGVASGLTADDRAELKKNKTPADTLKRGYGSGAEIDYLFAALASASGFDARVALVPDRADMFFQPSLSDLYFLQGYDIAVKVGDQWRFFDPGNPFVPTGMLTWREEGQPALVLDPKQPTFVSTQLTPPSKSVEKRSAHLTLGEDGTLEGDVRVEFTGHLSIQQKMQNEDDSPQQQEQNLRDKIKARLGAVQISDLHIENAADPVKPFAYSFHLRMPGYAQRTGKRLFFQPAFFQKGENPMFSASERKQLVYFHFPWSEEDTVMINLPAGFSLDHADAPAPFTAGKLSQYSLKLGITSNGSTLIANRKFVFGVDDKVMLFPVASYPGLKLYFDQVQKSDTHTITLKQGQTASAVPPAQ